MECGPEFPPHLHFPRWPHPSSPFPPFLSCSSLTSVNHPKKSAAERLTNGIRIFKESHKEFGFIPCLIHSREAEGASSKHSERKTLDFPHVECTPVYLFSTFYLVSNSSSLLLTKLLLSQRGKRREKEISMCFPAFPTLKLGFMPEGALWVQQLPGFCWKCHSQETWAFSLLPWQIPHGINKVSNTPELFLFFILYSFLPFAVESARSDGFPWHRETEHGWPSPPARPHSKSTTRNKIHTPFSWENKEYPGMSVSSRASQPGAFYCWWF